MRLGLSWKMWGFIWQLFLFFGYLNYESICSRRWAFEKSNARGWELFAWEGFGEVPKNHSPGWCGTSLGRGEQIWALEKAKPCLNWEMRDGGFVGSGLKELLLFCYNIWLKDKGGVPPPPPCFLLFFFSSLCLWEAAESLGLTSLPSVELWEVPVPQEVGLDLICCKYKCLLGKQTGHITPFLYLK